MSAEQASVLSPAVLDAGNPGVMTGRGNRTYLLSRADGSALLIDAGVGRPSHLEALRDALQARRVALTDVVVTHAHGDHMAGAATIASQYPAASFSKYPWPQEDVKAGVAWREMSDGQTLSLGPDSLTVVHTPGHAPDHCVLWHPKSRAVFSGDLVIPGGSVVIQPRRGGRMRDYLASLTRVAALAPERLFPAHGEPVDRPLRLLTASLEHRRQREAQVLEALAAGRDTVTAITESIYHGLPSTLILAAQDNVLAHLEQLREEQRVSFDAGRWYH